jgi:fibronectin-binding autotransporter adhesin
LQLLGKNSLFKDNYIVCKAMRSSIVRIMVKPGQKSLLLASSAAALAALSPDVQAQVVLGPNDLAVADEPADIATGVLFNGGRLRITAPFTSPPTPGVLFNLGGNGGTVEAQFSGVFTANGEVAGAGALTISGVAQAIVALSGTNTHSGGTVVSGGTLQIASDANLGASTGSLTLNGGGTLVTTATITSTRAIILDGVNGGGRILTGADTRLTLAGVVSGGASGVLQKAGVGTLVLSGANSLSGSIFITDGRLRLEASQAAGTAMILTQSRSNAPSPILSYADGIVVANRLQVNAFSSSGVTQLEVLAGESATQAGGISELGVASLPNRQAVEKIGGGTLILSGTNTHSGGTTVSAGTLRLQAGSLAASTVHVQANATLSGVGTIGGLQLASGALLSPGSTLSNAVRIGTLRSQGAVNLAAGSIFAVDLAPSMGLADRLDVTGSVTLGGTLQLVLAPPSVENMFMETSYTLITASGGITGQFQNVVNPFLFFNTVLTPQPNQLVLQLVRNQTNFSDLGGTFNQRSVASALNGVPFVNPLVAPFRMVTDAASTRAAFDQLSGEVFATTGGVLRNDSRLLRDRLVERLAFAQVPEGIALWSDFVTTNTDTDSDGNAAASSRTVTGFFSGLETTIAQKVRLGLASGYTKTRVRAQSRGEVNVDTGYLALYGGSSFGALLLKAGGSFAFHALESARTITQPGLAGRVQGNSKGETLQGFVEVAYALALDQRTSVAPFIQGAVASYKQKDALENSSAVASLSISSARETTFFSTLGVRFASQVRTPDEGRLIPRVRLAYQRADEERTPLAQLRFSQAGAPFQVAGSPLAKEQFLYEAGLAYITKNERLEPVAFRLTWRRQGQHKRKNRLYLIE